MSSACHGSRAYAKSNSLVLIHGLGGGHAWGTFQDPESGYTWPIDSLPMHLPEYRIITYGFDSKLPDSNSTQDLEALGSQLRDALRSIRPNINANVSSDGAIASSSILN